MLCAPMSRFLADQRGGGTIMGLLWFMLLVGITGMAVDTTNGFRSRTMLQATSAAASICLIRPWRWTTRFAMPAKTCLRTPMATCSMRRMC